MLALNLFLPDSPGWVVVPLSASAATFIGLLYPYVLGEDRDAPDGSKVMRCVAVFVGIYQASIVSFFVESECCPVKWDKGPTNTVILCIRLPLSWATVLFVSVE